VVMNSVVAFVPLGLLLARSMNLPALFGVALIYLGTYAGFNAAVLNPGTTGLSQRLGELPLFSGMGLRSAIYVAFTIVTLIFLTLYARHCRRHGLRNEAPPLDALDAQKATPRHWLILAFTAIALMVFMYGAVQFQWSETEMTAMFIIIAIGAGLLGRLSPSGIANHFLDGCAKLIHGALIVGLARAISIVLANGRILDPIVDFLSGLLAPLHPAMAAIGMFFSAALMHVAISSGSGESAALVPIYVPVGDAIHLTRQVTVQAILLGEGIINCFNPTSGVLMAVLATGGIGYAKWVRFVMPLTAVWLVISVVALIVGVATNWGPF
ncbi:MAG: YfcC family protein, partial [Janthinobacterium lividum]